MFLVTFLTLHYYYDFVPYPKNARMHMCVHPPHTHTHTFQPRAVRVGGGGGTGAQSAFFYFFFGGVGLKQQKFIFL